MTFPVKEGELTLDEYAAHPNHRVQAVMMIEGFGEPVMANSFQCDAVFADGALWKHGNVGQGIYIDPMRDFVGVYFSTNGYVPPYGEDRMPGYSRRAAKLLAGK